MLDNVLPSLTVSKILSSVGFVPFAIALTTEELLPKRWLSVELPFVELFDLSGVIWGITGLVQAKAVPAETAPKQTVNISLISSISI